MPKKFTLKEIQDIVNFKNGTLISNKYKNIKTRLKIKCNKCEEIFIISFKKIKAGSWCKFCNLSKPQKKLYYILKEIYPNFIIKNNYTRFSWLKTSSGGKQEIDIFIYNKDRSFTLAVEYDGEQHYKPIKFGAITKEQADIEFKKRQKLDVLKNKKIAKHKKEIKYFLRFSYKEELNKQNVINKLTDNKIPL